MSTVIRDTANPFAALATSLGLQTLDEKRAAKRAAEQAKAEAQRAAKRAAHLADIEAANQLRKSSALRKNSNTLAIARPKV